MVSLPASRPASGSAHRGLRVGYVPLTDSAPLLVAESERLFEKYGIDVRLSAEPGWATVREKLIHGELDAAESLAGLALALNYGVGCLPQPVIVPLVLSSNGNAITVSKDLPPSAFASGEALENYLENEWTHQRLLTLAAVHPCSSHHYLLKSWLTRLGFGRHDLLSYVFLPPPVLSRNLSAGHIDGFCVGEPWNSKSVLRGEGWCAATSVDLDDGHPEKVLAVPSSVAEARSDEIIALTAALIEACRLCQDGANHGKLGGLLEGLNAFDMEARDLRASLDRRTLQPRRKSRQKGPDYFHLFHGEGVNPPNKRAANWVASTMRGAGKLSDQPLKNLDRIFRLDVYDQALSTTQQHC